METSKSNSPVASDKRIKIKRILAEYLGVNADDIHDDDSLSEDLHMSSSELSDFMQKLAGEGIDDNSVDLTTIETVEDLGDAFTQEEF